MENLSISWLESLTREIRIKTYFLMLSVFQGIEMGGETARMMFWVEAKKKGLSSMFDNDNDNVTEGGDGINFDEPEVEPYGNGEDDGNEDDNDRDLGEHQDDLMARNINRPDLEAGENSDFDSAAMHDDISDSDE
jgi:hypothetical protein